MWLINTKTLNLEEFVDSSTAGRYAILSHTWGKEEVSFQDMASLPTARSMAGFAKIAATCEIALGRGLGYAWVDTCCINKDSSAELSEAINSMFKWYQHADVCFVYLSDLSPDDSKHPTWENDSGGPATHDIANLDACRWFSRGWTLQELIAPTYVEFYDANWRFRFTKDGWAPKLSSITRIDIEILMLKKDLAAFSVGVKMSWAAHRQTTRIEDQAYSLLGLFDINMPMLYGEGHKAFQRLQEEIAKETDDLSLFAWLAGGNRQLYRGVFAKSPLEFAFCEKLKRDSMLLHSPQAFSITNQGVSTTTNVFVSHDGTYFMDLGCNSGGLCGNCGLEHSIRISLQYTAGGWVRSFPGRCLQEAEYARYQRLEISIKKRVTWDESTAIEKFRSLSFKLTLDWEGQEGRVLFVPKHLQHPFHSAFVGEALSGEFLGSVYFSHDLAAELPLMLRVFCSAEGKIRVDFYANHCAGWDVLEGLTPNEHNVSYVDQVVDIYRRLEPVLGPGCVGRVRAVRRETNGRHHDVTFKAWLGEDLNISISRKIVVHSLI
ncbi:Vegetative incompatibility protein HET-E-1-like protein 11 [Colletotrichum chlorophyti]|uniref:Vegetative incompatibility protein HET-E-1-like protein 11 n=1 Tax=Colletotrichum chlorophyti TaxID=708187 RepID=A0A1Q8S403_9PEZI|nr:Vegetative incompatibility protein HET-E-1-like protein 11 [Colletotrichum chlorophyti]